ncbi:MAG: glycine--tRNA ligase subunit beta [Methylomonas sp.]|jgi:glycyl-tRNA synthetase beta chain|uniref:glycine--tRNA ligase subunit beta n=1 Tax=Methylomonas sp. TaxID=418 RepID=UPI0025CEB920|nr:glycine--tRNA ligase subunit beta [Methylomonas sp.]MCK9606874.1 glycine--tRNA ligase subunit beta [Methylomonas sp.]
MTATNHLLFELGCEELPPKSLKKLSQALLDNVLAGLNDAGLSYNQGRAYATPRRLAVLINDLQTFQADKVVEKRGPAVMAAFGPDGTPSKAAQGFAASCGASFEQLEKLETDKGAWLVFKQAVKGQSTAELIPDIIRKSLNNLPIAKRMRWGSLDSEFVRPVHWAVLLFGAQVIDTEILGIKTGRSTRGHRFHAPQALEIASPHDYLGTLSSQSKVLADFEERMAIIRDAANQAAANVGGEAHIEEDLLEEIAALNEWPVPVVGNFDARFLELPKEVLITTMQSNQKYFPVKNAEGGLLPHFITFANIESSNPVSIQQGNERVVLPRLSDAEFFWKQDRKQALADRVDSLKTIVFQKDLGTLFDKTERVAGLAVLIAEKLDADIALAKRAALLAKTDLMTNMVGEFANLQGTMGFYYARADGEDIAVARALEEQYFPKQSGGMVPQAQISVALALAEKIDTLAGIFSAGLIPTGDKDPYALRRATLGILRIIIENGLRLDVVELLDVALDQFSHSFNKTETRQKVIGFIFDRLRGYCLDQGYSSDEFEAVLAANPTQPFDFWQRIRAVQSFRQLPEAESLAAANKRIINILKKSEQAVSSSIGTLVEAEEKNLLAEAESSAADILPLLAEQNYQLALNRLAELRDSVDAFFDHVMVNTDDVALRNSRLALLAMLSNQFLQIADISKLQS